MTNLKDSAYPIIEEGMKPQYGFLKEEIVLKDFMCAFVSSRMGDFNHPDDFLACAKLAALLTETYFKQLNKQKDETASHI